MEFLDEPLRMLASFEEIQTLLKKGGGPVQLSGCVESQKVHIMSRAGSSDTRLVVTSDARQARLLLEDFRFFRKDCFLFPAKDLLFYQADVRSITIERDRMKVFRALREGAPVTIITTIDACMNRLVPSSEFGSMLLNLTEGGIAELKALTVRLTELGYRRMPRVEAPGEFSVQGGILDIFDITEENPFRIEFWDDEIDTIRPFSAESQLSLDGRLERVTIYPASELFLTDTALKRGRKKIEASYKKQAEKFREAGNFEAGAQLQALYREAMDAIDAHDLNGVLERFLPFFYDTRASLMDYLPEDSVYFLDEPLRAEESGQQAEDEFRESIGARLEKGLALPEMAEITSGVKKTMAALVGKKTLLLTGLDTRLNKYEVTSHQMMEVQSVVSYAGNFPGLVEDLKRYGKQKMRVLMLSASRTRASRIAEELRDYGISAYFSEDANEEIRPGTMLIVHGNLHRGFYYPSQKFIVLTEGDIFGTEKKKPRRKKNEYNGQKIRSFSELSVGDYVVHENYGIGIYKGIENIRTDGISRDYLKIAYGTSGNLFIPVTNLDVVQKYASSDAKPPKINRLDTPEWNKTKSRVRAAVQEVADELVQLYAARETGTGYRFTEDTVWQKEFEELFPYDETSDQLEAIRQTKEDMESGKIMDRLICGDVGFGKTEVAIRAAFKAVQDSKQVAYLVPTTILAQQHYKVFQQRMQNYPVTVAMLSRFSTSKQISETLQGLKSGKVDIVIGTHRILSKDVQFRDLGLLIIDEEQRFGVSHKEKIKQLKKNVDVLTLTATPIPRTLHMSMIGVRDMSVLEEAPTDRQAIQTYVMEYSEELVREAIQRELRRNGQVYYVYNRVSDISEITARVQALVPEANVAYAHGKMSERELERVMLDFIEGDIDVLVSTTIIETGLDIPNVNTIIVHDAERYGLSQLYQLRGRVGRSSRQAYAFIMYRKNRVLSEVAEKRLEAIRQFTELGSGIRIAMEDLEIRGAGALLGNAQSGHMMEVGYDLYCKMLSQAVQTAKGEEEARDGYDTLLDVKVDAYVPEFYVGAESVKLEVYKKISLITGEEDAEALIDELTDRFGDPPKPVLTLIHAARVRAKAAALYMTEIKGSRTELTFTFLPNAKLRGENMPALLSDMKGAMRYIQAEAPRLQWHQMNLKDADRKNVLDVLDELLQAIGDALISA